MGYKKLIMKKETRKNIEKYFAILQGAFKDKYMNGKSNYKFKSL